MSEDRAVALAGAQRTSLDVDDENTTRSVACRAALEAIFPAAGLLPDRGVDWRAESDEELVARLEMPPEQPELRLTIDTHGALHSIHALRWGKSASGRFDYVMCGAVVDAEHRFGDLAIPSAVRVGWQVGTPRFAAFFEARILSAEPPARHPG